MGFEYQIESIRKRIKEVIPQIAGEIETGKKDLLKLIYQFGISPERFQEAMDGNFQNISEEKRDIYHRAKLLYEQVCKKVDQELKRLKTLERGIIDYQLGS